MCQACTAAKQPGKPAGGLYMMGCVQCCARLVRSARPLRRAQDGMLAAIARFPGAPKRADVLAALKAGGLRW